MVHGVLLADLLAGAADHDAQFAFEHHLQAAAGVPDGAAGLEVGVRRLHQVQRFGRRGKIELVAQRLEVVPQGDDLGGLHRHEQAHVGQRDRAVTTVGKFEHVAVPDPHALAFERAESHGAAFEEAHPLELHGGS
jgi:hypothetical protein